MSDTLVSVPAVGHHWRAYIASWLLADEPARRSFIALVRQRAAEEGYRGRIVFRRAHSNAMRAFIENTTHDTYWIEVHP